MKLMVAYIAGPYRDPRGEWYVGQNIQAAEGVRDELVKLGIGVLCPHSNSSFCGGLANDDYWLSLGLLLLDRCDCVVVCPGSEQSKGTQDEIQRAKFLGIPVFSWQEEHNNMLSEFNRQYIAAQTLRENNEKSAIPASSRPADECG